MRPHLRFSDRRSGSDLSVAFVLFDQFYPLRSTNTDDKVEREIELIGSSKIQNHSLHTGRRRPRFRKLSIESPRRSYHFPLTLNGSGLRSSLLTLRSEKRVRESTVIGSVAVNLPRRASTVHPLRSASAWSPCRRVVSPPSSYLLLRHHRASTNLVSAFAVIPRSAFVFLAGPLPLIGQATIFTNRQQFCLHCHHRSTSSLSSG
ncbi:hypothetical protein PIB30_065168 [Stylosanthes scabra]|uniref:Uncharacterized protein n=1 Tax=Stylosanthes scabra TaxID=79078 RepID=A0ABU6SLX5_9FABA|nr:hypothetical protein [Stylosanthes scabra]